MKALFFIIALVIGSLIDSSAQSVYIPINVRGTVMNKLDKTLPEGSAFSYLTFSKEIVNDVDEKVVYVTTPDGKQTRIKFNNQLLNNLQIKIGDCQPWSYIALTGGVYSKILDNGFQYDIRHDLEQECLNYLSYLEDSNMLLEDDAIEDYLQSILLKIYPIPLNDGRTGQINIKVLKNNEPYAAILPSGTALISVGMLTLINSEEELISVLAHETAHFVLDHSVQTINQEIKRVKRAEFWAGLTAVAVAATTTYISAKNDIYIDPIVNNNLIVNSAKLAYSISSEINERIGLKYSRIQETEADNCAGIILKNLGMDPKSLGSVLSKIKEYYLITGNYKVFSDNGTHPNIINRIERFGTPTKEYKSTEYDNRIAFLLSMDAYFEYKQSHFKTTETLLNRIIEAGVASESDLVLKTFNNLAQYSSDDKYSECFDLLNKAKTLGVCPDYKIPKYESVIYFRKKDLPSAKKSLIDYKAELQKQISSFDKNLLVASDWNSRYNLLLEELDWTKKMINKTAN